MKTVTELAQQIADQELEACILLVGDGRRENLSQVIALRTARRPKPPSLKEQALEALEALPKFAIQENTDFICVIRRALNELPDN